MVRYQEEIICFDQNSKWTIYSCDILCPQQLTDMLFFILILLIVILGYGVITQAVLHPEAELEWRLVWNVLYKPYWQMYGELFLEDFQHGSYADITKLQSPKL